MQRVGRICYRQLLLFSAMLSQDPNHPAHFADKETKAPRGQVICGGHTTSERQTVPPVEGPQLQRGSFRDLPGGGLSVLAQIVQTG